MSSQTALFNVTTVAPPIRSPRAPAKTPTVLSYGLGADSTALIFKFLDDPTAYDLEPDLSDLVVVHAVTSEEFPDSIAYAERHVLPALRARSVRLVQVARAGKLDSEGIVILSDSRQPFKVYARGPYRLFDEYRTAGTLPQRSGAHICSIRFKGWVLDQWAAREFGTASFRRIIGYESEEPDRSAKDTAIQERRNREAGRVICTPAYPLQDEGWNRSTIEAYVLERTGEPISKSYCAGCCFSGPADNRERHEARLRAHPDDAVRVLLGEHLALALNENCGLYGKESLRARLAQDDRNIGLLAAFERALDRAPTAVYEVRRIYLARRTDLCRTLHGERCRRPSWWCRQERTPDCRLLHGNPIPQCDGPAACRLPARKGIALRSLHTAFTGTSRESSRWVSRFAAQHNAALIPGERSGILRAFSHVQDLGYPTTEAYFVAAPVGAANKERESFAERWKALTGLDGPLGPALRQPGGPPSQTAPAEPLAVAR